MSKEETNEIIDLVSNALFNANDELKGEAKKKCRRREKVEREQWEEREDSIRKAEAWLKSNISDFEKELSKQVDLKDGNEESSIPAKIDSYMKNFDDAIKYVADKNNDIFKNKDSFPCDAKDDIREQYLSMLKDWKIHLGEKNCDTGSSDDNCAVDSDDKKCDNDKSNSSNSGDGCKGTWNRINPRDVYHTLWNARDLEIKQLWQRSLILITFMVACFAGYFLLVQTLFNKTTATANVYMVSPVCPPPDSANVFCPEPKYYQVKADGICPKPQGRHSMADGFCPKPRSRHSKEEGFCPRHCCFAHKNLRYNDAYTMMDGDSWVFVNFTACLVAILGAIFSMLWIMMAKGSKAWQEKYEGALVNFEKNSKYVEWTVMQDMYMDGVRHSCLPSPEKVNNCLFSTAAGEYSVSKINIAVGQVFIIFWILAYVFHMLLFPWMPKVIGGLKTPAEFRGFTLIAFILALFFLGVVITVIALNVRKDKWVVSTSI